VTFLGSLLVRLLNFEDVPLRKAPWDMKIKLEVITVLSAANLFDWAIIICSVVSEYIDDSEACVARFYK